MSFTTLVGNPTVSKLKKLIEYVKLYPQSIFKAPYILLSRGPKKFFAKIENIEEIIELDPFQVTFNPIVLMYPKNFGKLLRAMSSGGLRKITWQFKAIKAQDKFTQKIGKQYELWYERHKQSGNALKAQKKNAQQLKHTPLISILLSTYNTDENFLKEALESVLSQTYPNWELCIVDDFSKSPAVKRLIESFAAKDTRIQYRLSRKNRGIAASLNATLKLATGSFVGVLDHDDILWPNALFEVASRINTNPESQLIYTDEDKLETDGTTHTDPFFKPDWSPDYLRSINYITHFTVLKRSLVDAIGGFDSYYDGAQDWDLFLKATYWLSTNFGHCHPLDPSNPIQHIPEILYSWRKTSDSTASEKHISSVKTYASSAQQRALEADLDRRKVKGIVQKSKFVGMWNVSYDLTTKPMVSIIIPTKNKYKFISRCLESIFSKTSYKDFEIILVDSGSTDQRVLKLYEEVRHLHKNVLIRKWTKDFNFSAACNFGAKQANGKYLLFLNNDTEIITADWLERMLEHCQREEVAAVGSYLLYPNGKLQHTGIIMGMGLPNNLGVAGHYYKNYFYGCNDPLSVRNIGGIRNFSGVTAACIMIRKKLFMQFLFDVKYRIAFNDVDLCLRLISAGRFILSTPRALLYHHESVSVGKPKDGSRDLQEFKAEIQMMNEDWEDLLKRDPFYNKNLSLRTEEFNINYKY